MDVLHKSTAHAAGPNPLTFVMSDASVDRMGDVIEPAGWDLRNFLRNPQALFSHDPNMPIGEWENLRVDGGKLLGDLKFGPHGACPTTDKMRAFVAAGMMRAVSVGFRPIDEEPRKGGGTRYTKSELVECSLVAVPANPNALALAKSLNLSDDDQGVIFGKSADEIRSLKRRGMSGEPAVSLSSHRKGIKMPTLSERIIDAQNELTRLKDQLTEHVKADDADDIVTDELAGRIEIKDASLAALKRAEAALGAKAVTSPIVPASPRSPLSAQFKGKPSDLIIRSAVVHGIAFHTRQNPEDVLERMYGDDEAIGMIVKAAVAPATTTQAGWAAELVNTAMADFIDTLRPESVYPALAAAGGGRLTFGPDQGAIKIPGRAATPSIGGSFIGEGGAIPVRRLGLSSVTLTPKKMGVITTFTREMARYSRPAIEALLRQEIVADTAITIDSVLVGTGAGDASTPAGLLSGVSALAATAGGGYAAILGDFKKLRAPFDAANAGSGLMLLMNPAQAESLNLTPGADGKLGWAADIIARYGVATSTSIPLGRVIMVRAADFVSATNDVPEFELSNDATVHMEDSTPLALSAAGTPNTVAAPVRSFFQTGVSGLRMIMDISWGMRRAGMAQYIDGVTW